jgi:hypothetical protein
MRFDSGDQTSIGGLERDSSVTASRNERPRALAGAAIWWYTSVVHIANPGFCKGLVYWVFEPSSAFGGEGGILSHSPGPSKNGSKINVFRTTDLGCVYRQFVPKNWPSSSEFGRMVNAFHHLGPQTRPAARWPNSLSPPSCESFFVH